MTGVGPWPAVKRLPIQSCCAAILLIFALPAAGADSVPAVVVQPARAFGYVLGDVLRQRILLERRGSPVTLTLLPPLRRIDPWLQRQAARVVRDGRGRPWLLLDYQIINAPRSLMAVALPPLDLPTQEGAVLRTAPWPISVGPITPGEPFGQGDLQPLRPDRAAATPAREAIERRLQQSLAATLLVLAAWAGWWLWRNHLDARRLPFMRAWNTIKRLRAAPGDEPPDTWILLHRAMNAAAGCAMHAGSVEFLVARLPHLRPLKPRIAEFYQASNRRFFEQSNQDTPFALREFCDALRRAESAHEK